MENLTKSYFAAYHNIKEKAFEKDQVSCPTLIACPTLVHNMNFAMFPKNLSVDMLVQEKRALRLNNDNDDDVITRSPDVQFTVQCDQQGNFAEEQCLDGICW